VDRTGKPAAAGAVGELVLTTLGRAGSPAVRYRTGDVVRLGRPAPCSCGRSFAALEGGILGRSAEWHTLRGVDVFPSAIEECVRRVAGIAEYRVEVSGTRAASEVTVLIEPAPEENGVALAKSLAAEFDKTLGVRLAVEVEALGTLPRFETKARRWAQR
jgi:phenylacetate-CoA ligase